MKTIDSSNPSEFPYNGPPPSHQPPPAPSSSHPPGYFDFYSPSVQGPPPPGSGPHNGDTSAGLVPSPYGSGPKNHPLPPPTASVPNLHDGSSMHQQGKKSDRRKIQFYWKILIHYERSHSSVLISIWLCFWTGIINLGADAPFISNALGADSIIPGQSRNSVSPSSSADGALSMSAMTPDNFGRPNSASSGPPTSSFPTMTETPVWWYHIWSDIEEIFV